MVLEHKASGLNKLKITGNGKCNFSNRNMDVKHYHNNPFIGRYLNSFSPDDAIAWFKSIGLDTVEKYGYLYPASESAADVADKLITRAEELGVEFRYSVKDIDITKLREEYDSIIIAAGSFAYKKTGSDGSGYKLLEKLGVHYTRVLPALCPLICEDDVFFERNHGKRIIGRATAIVDGVKKGSDTGEILITENGLSGLAVMNISRYASRALDEGKKAEIEIDTDVREDDIPAIIRNHRSAFEIRRVFTVTKMSRFDKSLVCTGGVRFEDMDDDLQLKDVPGVYCVGEICDVDAVCGGYSLHWAWCSGLRAGRAAAGQKVKEAL